MRRLILLALFITTPLSPAASVTVAQLEQALTEARAAHRPDAKIVLQIGTTKLSERLTEATQERLTKNWTLDARVAQALQLLADQSAFLDLPASELPAITPPNDSAQRRMLERRETMSRSPCPFCPISSPPEPPGISTIAPSN